MDAWLERAARGMATVAVPEAVRATARDNLARWWTEPPFAAYRDTLRSLIERGAFEELVDSFRQVLPFGTGGRRGAVGVGPNRMNPYTVSTSVQGHVRWLRHRFPVDERLRVVVAYDVRRFDDVRGIYDPAVPNPVRGMTSRDLAELAARVYAANGVEVCLLARDAGRFLSTPELSFTIRELGAHGGLNLSASHNPPDDNGVKVYDQRGAQPIPPLDEQLLVEVEGVDEARIVGWDEALRTGLVRFLEPEVHQAYVATLAALAGPGPRGVKILYTPLHGTGAVAEVLRAAGFDCRIHEPQATFDGAFPTVPGGVANPENPEAMAHAIAAAGDADLVMGTDPDADRIGVEVRHRGRWVHLTGNDLAALVVSAAVRRELGGRRPLVIQTEVTSVLIARIARAAGAAVVDDLLVGFKYVAEVLRALEEEGAFGPLLRDEVAFVAGVEESHGALVTDRIRDKDSGGAALLLAVAAAQAAERGLTLVDELHELERTFGYVKCGQVSLKYEGATGQQRLAELLDGLRAAPPRSLAGRTVVEAIDHRDPAGRFGPFVSGSDRAARNVLVYHLAAAAADDGARVILRPSGTEPKLKVYLEVQGRAGLDDAGRAEVDAALRSLGDAAKAWLGS